MNIGKVIDSKQIKKRRKVYASRYDELIAKCLKLQIGQAVTVDGEPEDLVSTEKHQNFRDRIYVAVKRGVDGSGMRFRFLMTDKGIAISRIRNPKTRKKR